MRTIGHRAARLIAVAVAGLVTVAGLTVITPAHAAPTTVAAAASAPQRCHVEARRNNANWSITAWIVSNRVNRGKVYSFRLFYRGRVHKPVTWIPTYQSYGPKYVYDATKVNTIYGWQNGFLCDAARLSA